MSQRMKWQELNNVVLVGHSYGGMVISGVAEQMEKSIASFVMLDAFMPENGQSLIDMQPPAPREAILAAERQGATSLPPRPAEFFKVNEKDRAWVDAQCTPQPIKCFLQKLTLTGARERIAKKTYIRATVFPSPYFDAGLASARAKKVGVSTKCRAATTLCSICRNGWSRYSRTPPERATAQRPAWRIIMAIGTVRDLRQRLPLPSSHARYM